ncbi:1098_t:CDS:1, partial [Entrophospora sp. SA101]
IPVQYVTDIDLYYAKKSARLIPRTSPPILKEKKAEFTNINKTLNFQPFN